jgi:adhesin transport system membrane fusion protein
VAPGSTILEVIPSDAILIDEARVLPKDIGFVRKGQLALIKVGTYDYTRFGGIEGKIETISAR